MSAPTLSTQSPYLESDSILSSQIFKFLLIISCILIFNGCTFSTRADNAILNSLKDRGAVPLSSQNPFLAANLLLSHEMERSPELKGFIETRGMPDALEAVKSWSKPTTLRFYYIDKKEYYSAEESDNTWILHGPQKIPAGGVKLLLSIVEGGENTAPPVNEKSLALRLPSSGTQEYKPNERPQAPPPAIKSLSSSGSTWDDPLLPTVLRYKDTTTQMAEISPNGDLVHHVSYPGESLMMITRWYTFDIRNVGRISRINDIKNPSHVDIGDTIIIPSYLVKNKKRLSEEVLRNLYKDLEGKL